MTFPTSVTAKETAATLTTVEGSSVELPRTNGGTDVTYVFGQAADSAEILESFDIVFTVSATAPVETLQPTIEVSLAPLGAATPTTALPSTAIPRFSESRSLVLAGSSRTISRQFYWPGVDSVRTNELTLFNRDGRSANVTVEGFGADGTLISSAQIGIAASEIWTDTLQTLLGSIPTTLRAIRVLSTDEGVEASGGTIESGIEETLELADRGGFRFLVPSGTDSRLNVWNTTNFPTDGSLELRSRSGNTLASVAIRLDPLASFTNDLVGLFEGLDENEYVAVNFDQPVVVTLEKRSSQALASIPQLSSIGTPALFVPYVVSGSGMGNTSALCQLLQFIGDPDPKFRSGEFHGSEGDSPESGRALCILVERPFRPF